MAIVELIDVPPIPTFAYCNIRVECPPGVYRTFAVPYDVSALSVLPLVSDWQPVRRQPTRQDKINWQKEGF